MCLAQGHNTVMPVRLEPTALRSRVKRSTTEPLHSQIYTKYGSEGRFKPKHGALGPLDSCICMLNSFLASSNFNHLLIAFANSLDPDKDRQNVSPDLDPNHLTL